MNDKDWKEGMTYSRSRSRSRGEFFAVEYTNKLKDGTKHLYFRKRPNLPSKAITQSEMLKLEKSADFCLSLEGEHKINFSNPEFIESHALASHPFIIIDKIRKSISNKEEIDKNVYKQIIPRFLTRKGKHTEIYKELVDPNLKIRKKLSRFKKD